MLGKRIGSLRVKMIGMFIKVMNVVNVFKEFWFLWRLKDILCNFCSILLIWGLYFEVLVFGLIVFFFVFYNFRNSIFLDDFNLIYNIFWKIRDIIVFKKDDLFYFFVFL